MDNSSDVNGIAKLTIDYFPEQPFSCLPTDYKITNKSTLSSNYQAIIVYATKTEISVEDLGPLKIKEIYGNKSGQWYSGLNYGKIL